MDHAKLNSILMRTAAVLLLLVLLSTGLLSGRYARYVTTAQGEDSARVAKFMVTHEIEMGEQEQQSEPFSPDIRPGESFTFTFSIKNDSEVAVLHTVTVANDTGNLPLTFQITGKTEEEKDICSASWASSPGKHEQVYTVTVTWPKGDNDTDYIGMVDRILITVVSAQID